MTADLEEKKIVSIFDTFETDVSAEEDGRWFHDFAGPGTGSVKLRRMSSKKSIATRRRLEMEYRKFRKGQEWPEAIADAMVERQLAEAILIDWKLTGREGEPLEFSVAAAKELVNKLPAFKLQVMLLSQDLDGFRKEASEDILKN